MPFTIQRHDLVTMAVDAIVNPANPQPAVGSGTDYAVHAAAGPRLLEARKKIGPIPVGQARITPGFDLPAKYVIHAVGPQWQGGKMGEEFILGSTCYSAMNLAWREGCRSLALPLLCTGNYGFPGELALRIIEHSAEGFLQDHDMEIILVVFGQEHFCLAKDRFREVESFLDEFYVEEKLRDEYEIFPSRDIPVSRAANVRVPPMAEEACLNAAPDFGGELEDLMENMDAGFSETLLALIDRRGKTDAEVYKKANIDRKLFSKIKNNSDYRPSKATALAFAIALELDLEETEDLIGRAGYALSHSSKADIIIEYFIRHRNYNIFDINEALFAFDQMLLGA